MFYFVEKYYFFSSSIYQPTIQNTSSSNEKSSKFKFDFVLLLSWWLNFFEHKNWNGFQCHFWRCYRDPIPCNAKQERRRRKKDENKTEVVSIICRTFEYTMFLFIFFLHRFFFLLIYTWIEYPFILLPFIVYFRIVEDISI